MGRTSPNKDTPWIAHTEQMLYVPNVQGVIEQTIRIGSAPWYLWLATATKFYVRHPHGNFFCRKEGRPRGGWYWLAYRRHVGRLYKSYVGKDEDLDSAKLDGVAYLLNERQRPRSDATLY